MAAPNGTLGPGSSTCSIEEFTRNTFDYIICGGGTAGLAIAARLSENPDVRVGVVEAGKNRIGDPLVDTPAAFVQMFEDPEYDWCLYTAPQVRSPPPQGRHPVLTMAGRKRIMGRFIMSLVVNSSAARVASTI